MIGFKQHKDVLAAEKETKILVEERPNKTIVVGAPHHAPGGIKELPCPEHTDSDENTGQLAHLLADRLQVPAIIVCNATVDPNKSLDTDYAKTIVKWAPDFLIEIHGHGGRATSENAIEVSSGSLDRNAWSKAFAGMLQEKMNSYEPLKKFVVTGDFETIHFKASKTATILHPKWISIHIELPPALRIGPNNDLPETTDLLLTALDKTIRLICVPKVFDIKTESQALKDLACQFDSDVLIDDLFSIMQEIQPPVIPFQPFDKLDSPLKQLTYIASLNLTSDPGKVRKQKATNDDWESMISQCIKAKAGYFDLFLPKESEEGDEFHNFYKVALPVFLNYYDTSVLNFEEQELERIERVFKRFDEALKRKFGLGAMDFINIYSLLDQRVFEQFNKPRWILRDDQEARTYFLKIKEDQTPLSEINYDGNNENIKEFIRLASKMSARATVTKESFYQLYDSKQIDSFFQLLSLERSADDSYLYYTNPNRLLRHPIYKKSDGTYLIMELKQLLYAISVHLHEFLSNDQNLRERYFKHRGECLHNKTAEVIDKFFDNSAFIHSEYRTALKGDGQDLLVVHKGLALIVEVKAGREPEPRRDTVKGFEQIMRGFKRTIQEGYNQAYRVKDQFDFEDSVEIYNERDELVHTFQTNKFHSVFILIVTQETFREAQINLPSLLKLNEDDDVFPLSICIDDLETILLAMKKKKMGLASLVKFLTFRQQLQGRTNTNDETDLWATFIKDPKFSIPANKEIHFKPSSLDGELFEELYKEGLGFTNEKNLDKKKDKRWQILAPHELRKLLEKNRESSG